MGQPTTTAAQRPRRGRMGFVLRWAMTILLIGLAAAFVDISAALQAIEGADRLWLSVGLALSFLGTIVIPAEITRLAQSAQGRTMSLARLVEINLTNRFYIIVLPRAAAVAIRWYRYGQGTLSAEGLALMLFERGVQLATLMVVSLFALWFDRAAIGDMAIPLLLTTAGGTALALIGMLPFASAKTERFTRYMLGPIGRVLPGVVVAKLERLIGSASLFRSLPRGPAAGIIAWSLAASLLFFASAWFAAASIGLHVSLLSLVWIRSLVFLMTLAPITVGGMGVRELGFVGLLSLIGIAAPVALAFSAVNFAFQLAQAMVGALIEGSRILIASGHKKRDVRPC